MKKIFLLLFSAPLLLNAQSTTQTQATDLKTLSLSAEGIAEIMPDIVTASITMSASIYDQNPRDVYEKLVNDALEDLKIKGNVKQTNTNINNSNSYNNNACTFFTKTYSISMSSIEDFEKLRSACENFKRSTLKVECVLTFLGLRNETLIKNKIVAYENALKNAKMKAELAVKTLGGNLGPAISLTENTSYSNNSSYNYKDQYYNQDKNVKVVYVYTVNVKFLLKE